MWISISWASLVAQLVKNLPAIRETWVQSLGWEDPLKKGTATHSSILAWRIPWAVYSMGLQRVGHDWATFTFKAVCIRDFMPLLGSNNKWSWMDVVTMGTCEKDWETWGLCLCVFLLMSVTEHDSICEMFFLIGFSSVCIPWWLWKMGQCPAGIEKQHNVI